MGIGTYSRTCTLASKENVVCKSLTFTVTPAIMIDASLYLFADTTEIDRKIPERHVC